MTRYTLPLLLSLPMILAAQIALAEGAVRAVLVGVGDYLVLDADLKGPPADAALMADTLMLRRVAAGNIRVLAAGATPAVEYSATDQMRAAVEVGAMPGQSVVVREQAWICKRW
jgi:glutamate mutase epsilon subunit